MAFMLDLHNNQIQMNKIKTPPIFIKDSGATPNVLLDWIKKFNKN
jgi:hypothetical protein